VVALFACLLGHRKDYNPTMILNFAHESELEELKHLDKIASLLPTKGVIQVNL
jgi:hypothetical protein